jgi:hypothetical protein
MTHPTREPSELEKIVGDAIAEALDTRAFGLYDYSAYPGEDPPHVVRDERTGEAVFRSLAPEPAEAKYIELSRTFVARAALTAAAQVREGATPVEIDSRQNAMNRLGLRKGEE